MAQKIIFVGGKGGVGKTTTAASFALNAARKGYKTLLVSTDPSHNIGHLFHKKIGGKKVEVEKNLYALEIDAAEETKKYIQTVKAHIKEVIRPTMMEEVNRQLETVQASPGADEAALFDKLISIILDEGNQFDRLIFDTAPTGHTIRLLSLPELMGVWIQGMLERRHKTKENYARLLHDGTLIDDPIYEVLKQRQKRFKKVRDILLDPEQTGFIFVLNPEYLPIVETKQALSMLEKYDLHVHTLVVNRLLPEKDTGTFFAQRKANEKKHIGKIHDVFSEKQLFFVPFFSHDIMNKQQLERFSSYVQIE